MVRLTLILLTLLLNIVPIAASISSPYGEGIEAVIFDCDGVLVDTEYLKFLAWQEALARDGISFTIEDYKPLVGHSSKNIAKMIQEQKDVPVTSELIELKNAIYKRLQRQGVTPIEEAVLGCHALSERRQELGIKLGLASSAPREEILQNLSQIGLQDAFDVIVSGSDDLDAYIDSEGTNKPKPYIYIEAAKQLGVLPSQCLVFEDTAAGIEAAAGAGMIPIALPNQFTQEQDFSKAVNSRELGQFQFSSLTEYK
jgi:beta-phosphoglucomutase